MERCSIRRLQDSYTDGGRDDGGPLAPPVVVPPDAEAGGRSTNGKVWVEHFADDAGATLMDYAVSTRAHHAFPVVFSFEDVRPLDSQQSGACTDLSLWPSAIKKVDFLGQSESSISEYDVGRLNITLAQVSTFLNQSNTLDPESTLYVVFFGIK